MTNEVLNAANGTTPIQMAQQKGTGGAAFVNTRMASEVYRSGVLPNSTVQTIVMAGAPCPCTVTLTSAAAGRLIQLSTDAISYFTPIYDANTVGMINVSVQSAVQSIQLTGVANDTWSVL